MKDFDYSHLDPGIRDLVKALHTSGFETIDSGDGVSKYEDPDCNPIACPVYPGRHVWLKQVQTEAEAADLQSRLIAFCRGPGLTLTEDMQIHTCAPAGTVDDYLVGLVQDGYSRYEGVYDEVMKLMGVDIPSDAPLAVVVKDGGGSDGTLSFSIEPVAGESAP